MALVFIAGLLALIEDVKYALYCSKICSYAQGMAMLSAANLPAPDTSKGQEVGGGDEPGPDRLVRRVGDEDADAEGLHPRANVRHERPGPQDREHAVPEGGE